MVLILIHASMHVRISGNIWQMMELVMIAMVLADIVKISRLIYLILTVSISASSAILQATISII